MDKIIGLIPVRLNSKRLKQKALLNIQGLPMIVHTLKRALMAKKLNDVFVCTDSHKIKEVVEKHNGKCLLTKENHRNGTERIAEVAKKIKAKYYVDIQGDEPLINPKHIDKLIDYHKKNNQFDIVVPFLKIKNAKNKNIVKIVSNEKNKILFFSRSIIPNPFKKKINYFKKHLSIISFKRAALLDFAKLKASINELHESIELMRAIDNGLELGTFELIGDSFSVDIKRNYLDAIRFMKNDKTFKKYKI